MRLFKLLVDIYIYIYLLLFKDVHVVATAFDLLGRLNIARNVLFRCPITNTPLAQRSSQSEPMFIPRRSARAYGLVDIKPMGESLPTGSALLSH